MGLRGWKTFVNLIDNVLYALNLIFNILFKE